LPDAHDFTVTPVCAIRGNNYTGAARTLPLTKGQWPRDNPKDPQFRQNGVVAVYTPALLAHNHGPETPGTTQHGRCSTTLEVYAADEVLHDHRHHHAYPPGLVEKEYGTAASVAPIPGPRYVPYTSDFDVYGWEATKAAGHKELQAFKYQLDVRLSEDVSAGRNVVYTMDLVAVESRDGAPMTAADVSTVQYKVYFTAGFADDSPLDQLGGPTDPATAPRGIPEASLRALEVGAAAWSAFFVTKTLQLRSRLLREVCFGRWVPALEEHGVMPFFKAAFTLPFISSSDHPACTSLYGTVKTRDEWYARVVAPHLLLPEGWHVQHGSYCLRYLRRTMPLQGEVLAAQFMLTGPAAGSVEYDHYRTGLPGPADVNQDVLAERGYRMVNLSVKLERDGPRMAAVVKLDDVRVTARVRLHTGWLSALSHQSTSQVFHQLRKIRNAEHSGEKAHLLAMFDDVTAMVVEATRVALVRPSLTLREAVTMRPLDRVLRGAHASLARGEEPAPAPQLSLAEWEAQRKQELCLAALDVVAAHFYMARPYDPVRGGLRTWATLPPAVFPPSNACDDVPPQEDMATLQAVLNAALGLEEEDEEEVFEDDM